MTNKKMAVFALLAASLFSATAPLAGAESQISPSSSAVKPVSIYVNGQRFLPETPPMNVSGTLLVPIRGIFEAQGAKLSWNNAAKTITATQNTRTLVYHIGDHTAHLDGQSLNLPVPGRISNGRTLVPLRFISETLGSQVKWDAANQTVWITKPAAPALPVPPAPPSPDAPASPAPVRYETSIRHSVNLRSVPSSDSSSTSLELLPAGTKVHVLRIVNALWLQVQTEDKQTGYLSAKPEYSDYTSAALAELQGDALIAEGKKYLGTPYLFGASPDQTKTFDCSSFVKRVFQDTLSISLPRVSYDQAKEGKEVSLSQLRKGDLLFFSARGLDIGHVGIYMGNNEILHTYSKEEGVHIETFSDKWKKRFVTARRLF